SSSNSSVVSALASNSGSCFRKYQTQLSAMGNVAGRIVPSGPGGVRLLNRDPLVSPYQRRSPSLVRGPSQIFRTTSAVSAEMVVSSPSNSTWVPTSSAGSNPQRSGSPMTPSTTPSAPSQASIAASVNASNSHGEG